MLGLRYRHALLSFLLLLLLLGLGLGVRIGHVEEETRGRVRLELELAIVAADDPGDEELLPGISESFRVGSGRRVGFGRREDDVELSRRRGGEGTCDSRERAEGSERE